MTLDVDEAVRDRYGQGTGERQENLCCPVEYGTGSLEMLPLEFLDRG